MRRNQEIKIDIYIREKGAVKKTNYLVSQQPLFCSENSITMSKKDRKVWYNIK